MLAKMEWNIEELKKGFLGWAKNEGEADFAGKPMSLPGHALSSSIFHWILYDMNQLYIIL